MTTARRIASSGCVGLILGSLGAILGASCQGPDPSPPTGPSAPQVTACGLHAAECVPLAGSSPNGLAIADLNGDGAPDIAVDNMGADNLSVLLNDGRGRLTLDANYAVGDSPFVVRIADFDGDGHPDLVSTGGSALYLWINNGDGTFRRGNTITLSDPAFSLATADFDGDGSPDIAAAHGLFRSISILVNDGHGKFTKTPQLFVPGDFSQLGYIAAADVDGDSRPDLIVVHTYVGKVSVFKNTGGGAFAPPAQVDLGATHILYWPTPVDVDGDGYVDLAVADGGDPLDKTTPGTVDILRNNGTGAFTLMARLAAGGVPVNVTSADFNGDGLVDLAVANSASNDVSILLGTGGGEFAGPMNFAVGEGPSFVAAADLNGDGHPDLAVTNFHSDSVSILLNDGTGQFAPQP